MYWAGTHLYVSPWPCDYYLHYHGGNPYCKRLKSVEANCNEKIYINYIILYYIILYYIILYYIILYYIILYRVMSCHMSCHIIYQIILMNLHLMKTKPVCYLHQHFIK